MFAIRFIHISILHNFSDLYTLLKKKITPRCDAFYRQEQTMHYQRRKK